MSNKHPRPVLHRRDHEHGGADPVRIVYESVGDGGSGAATGSQVFAGFPTTIAAGISQTVAFGTASGDPLTSVFSGSDIRVFADPGFYAVDVNVLVNLFTAGRAFDLEITAFAVGVSSGCTATAGAGATSTYAGRTGVGEVSVGGLLQVAVRNGDTVSRDFTMYCRISRLA